MKKVEYWAWKKLNYLGKWERTSYKMDEETALARHPEAVRVPGTMELRDLEEPGDDPTLSLNRRPRWKESPDSENNR